MGNSFVLFYVSMEISWGNFHLGEIGHTQKVASSWAGSHLPMGKLASVTAPIYNIRRKYTKLY